MTVWTPQPTHE